MAEPVMNLYTEATDGSYIETKETALVWHHQDADPGFGSSQAKEMLDHLESVLANEPVAVKSGQFIVEVKPQVCGIDILQSFHKVPCFFTDGMQIFAPSMDKDTSISPPDDLTCLCFLLFLFLIYVLMYSN